MIQTLQWIIGEERAWDFRARAGSTFAFSGSGRVGPRPVCGVKARAGSGFEYSSSGRVGPSPNYEVKALSFDWVNGMKLVIPFFQPKFDALKLLVKRCWRISALWRFWLLGCLCSWSSGGLGLWTFELGPSRAWARSKNFGLEHSKKLEKRLGSGSGRARAQARSSPNKYAVLQPWVMLIRMMMLTSYVDGISFLTNLSPSIEPTF